MQSLGKQTRWGWAGQWEVIGRLTLCVAQRVHREAGAPVQVRTERNGARCALAVECTPLEREAIDECARSSSLAYISVDIGAIRAICAEASEMGSCPIWCCAPSGGMLSKTESEGRLVGRSAKVASWDGSQLNTSQRYAFYRDRDVRGRHRAG